jgi:hypothetical protein
MRCLCGERQFVQTIETGMAGPLTVPFFLDNFVILHGSRTDRTTQYEGSKLMGSE